MAEQDTVNNQPYVHREPIQSKQREMDDVVRAIYEGTKKIDEERTKADSNAKPTLIILCGGYGMNEVGRPLLSAIQPGLMQAVCDIRVGAIARGRP